MAPPRHEQNRPPDVEIDDLEDIDLTRWKVDRHIPVALLIALFAQTGGAIWWAASTSGRVDVLERQAVANASAVVATATSSATLSERMVKLETKFDGVAESLTEIKNILRQVPTRQAP